MNTYLCTLCATWTCAACGWRRSSVGQSKQVTCFKCKGTEGSMVPTRHPARHRAHRPVVLQDIYPMGYTRF